MGETVDATLAPTDERTVIKWLENQPAEDQISLSQERLQYFLAQAEQPRHASGNACIKLCHFVEQCRSSKSCQLRALAFSENTSLSLFNFFIEWSERNQNRSMRLVLELASSLITTNPEKDVAKIAKASILNRSMLIILHQAAQPLVKPAFKSLECFLSKGAMAAEDVLHNYQHQNSMISSSNTWLNTDKVGSVWDSFFADVFEWMTFPDVSPAAGKFLVTIFRDLRKRTIGSTDNEDDETSSWQRWIRCGLISNPGALENVKNYLFPPLFKIDRIGSLAFLKSLNVQEAGWNIESPELNAQALLRLSALEVGKKSGLVEEPDTLEFNKIAKKKSAQPAVILNEESIGPLLSNASETVRSLAFSVIVSSVSSVRPFSTTALDLLRSNMGILFCDTDAKFRNEILSNTKQMIDRLRGATSFLARELENLTYQLGPSKTLDTTQHETFRKVQCQSEALFEYHGYFIKWYLKFLLKELYPSASYQRHITSLKAIALFLRSGILEGGKAKLSSNTPSHSTVWPYTLRFFTPGSLRLLMDLLLDPFEDVRSSACNILKLAPPSVFSTHPKNFKLREGGTDSSVHIEMLPSQAHCLREDTSVIADCTTQSSPDVPLSLLITYTQRAELLSKQTCRADYADGVARCYELLYTLQTSAGARLELLMQLVSELEHKINVAEKSLGQAVVEAPVHGSFAALNFVWCSVDFSKDFENGQLHHAATVEFLRSLQQRISDSCCRIWELVKDILCNDSPEGHLPDDLDEVDSIDTKDILSYSFRGIHESSNLMRTIVEKVKIILPGGEKLLPAAIFSQIGNLSFDQLSNLRHRGAFSTVSLTFSKCCQLTQYHSTTSDLLSDWYQGALDCISKQASTTRRSAGIPALITGIMSANTPSIVGSEVFGNESTGFEDIMATLKALSREPAPLTAKDETAVKQVHSMNCLKEVFKSSTLGKRSDGEISDCFQLASQSLKSQVWAIRNCALILLRSIIDHLFGTSESKATMELGWDGRSVKISYDKYPALPKLILELLDPNNDKHGVESSVFPALDIIRRAGPPHAEREDIKRRIIERLRSDSCHVREKSAEALCSILLNDDIATVIGDLVKPTECVNSRHGTLLAIRFILDRQLSIEPARMTSALKQLLPLLASSWSTNDPAASGTMILAAQIEVYNAVARILLSCSPEDRSEFVDLAGPLSLQSVRDNRILPRAWWDCGPAFARMTMYQLALDNRRILELPRIFQQVLAGDPPTVIAGLKCTKEIRCFKHLNGLSSGFSALCAAYILCIQLGRDLTVIAAALDYLSEVLDANFHRQTTAEMKTLASSILQIKRYIEDKRQSPEILKSMVRISGWLYVLEGYSPSIHPSSPNGNFDLGTWALLISHNSRDCMDFDMRISAALALRSFYIEPSNQRLPPPEPLLPSLLALYDILNDDDSDIRDIGANVVSMLLKQSLTPPSASVHLRKKLLEYYPRSPVFAWSVVCRMTRTSKFPINNNAITLASIDVVGFDYLNFKSSGNVLFAEEKQNLWIDDLEEVVSWSQTFHSMFQDALGLHEDTAPPESPFKAILSWANNEIQYLTGYAKSDDLRPLDTPLLIRLCSINTVLDFYNKNVEPLEDLHAGDDSEPSIAKSIWILLSSLEEFTDECIRNDVHPMILDQLLSRDSLTAERRQELELQSEELALNARVQQTSG